MMSCVLFYTSIFDVTKNPDVDIADPGGLVRSLVVRNADRSLSLVLNGSQSQHTASARFLSQFFGSGVQHIAFATGDIFAAAKALKTAGLPTLPIPDNYYDDLDARFALPQDVLAELRGHGILYDRDQDGEFFQIFTGTFFDRFFFEIVERRGYRGFGAGNAAIRLAVQRRQSRHSHKAELPAINPRASGG
jgi:4-hydroxyphenylpyruvate dioxygenase